MDYYYYIRLGASYDFLSYLLTIIVYLSIFNLIIKQIII